MLVGKNKAFLTDGYKKMSLELKCQKTIFLAHPLLVKYGAIHIEPAQRVFTDNINHEQSEISENPGKVWESFTLGGGESD